MSNSADTSSFCTACGSALAADSRFCPACGAPSGGGGGAQQRPTRVADDARTALSPVAIVVFLVFLGVGGAGLYAVLGTTRQPERAVPGSPSAAAGQRGGNGDLPAGHPSIEIPPEVVSLLDELTEKAQAAPKDVEAWQNLARARYRAGLLNRSYVPSAIAAVEHVLDLDPNNLEAIRTRGNIAYDNGDYAEADKHFSRYLELDSTDPGVRTDLASAKLFEGQTSEARQMYEAVLEKNPDFLQAHVNLGIALHAEGREDEALEHFNRARELAKTPEQSQRVDEILAMVKERSGGRAPGSAPAAAAPAVATPGAGTQVASASGSNASTDFQREVDRALTQHRIIGPKISAIEWKAPGTAEVRIQQFPMDKMPPVMRNKFKSTMNELIADAAKERGVDAELHIDLVDADSGRVMDTLDGKEWVGAFDEQNYQ